MLHYSNPALDAELAYRRELAMLAGKGTSVLRNVDIIARGYEHLYERLVEMGASLDVFHD